MVLKKALDYNPGEVLGWCAELDGGRYAAVVRDDVLFNARRQPGRLPPLFTCVSANWRSGWPQPVVFRFLGDGETFVVLVCG